MQVLEDQLALKKTKVVNILNVVKLSLKDSENLYEFHLDAPKKEEQQSTEDFHISGWVLGKKYPVESVAILFEDRVIQKIPLTETRQDVIRAYGDLAKIQSHRAIGFSTLLNLREISQEQTAEILVQAVFPDESKEEVAKITIGFNAQDFDSQERAKVKIYRNAENQLTDTQNKIGSHWNKEVQVRPKIFTWMNHPYIVNRINQKVGGIQSDLWSDGLLYKLQMSYSTKIPFKNAVSVASGSGHKEMRLIKQGIVEHFDIFEYAAHRVEEGKKLAEKYGITEKITFHVADAFEEVTQGGIYDLVYWNNALHHMSDVYVAVRWSYQVLESGGVFYLDDYVGASRFQFSDRLMEVANQVRNNLPASFYIKNDNYQPRPPQRPRPNPTKVAEVDPSEAADSARILDAVREVFPKADIIPTSSGIYRLISDLMPSFTKDHETTLAMIALLDDLLMEEGEILWATALAHK